MSGTPTLSDILDGMAELYLKYVTFTNKDHAFICALWCAHTWLFRPQEMHGIDSTGYLSFVSPVSKCGKTAALKVTSAFSRGQPDVDVSPTPAIVFRSIGETRETIIFDEMDTLTENKDFVAVLNAGYKKGSRVRRMVGRDRDKVGHFNTFCPKALGYIRNQESLKAIKETLESRCIKILLKRRTAKEHANATPLRSRKLASETEDLVYHLAKWELSEAPMDFVPLFKAVEMKELTDGREFEVWENLLAIAHLAGRLDDAKRMALDLIQTNREEVEDHDSMDTQILHDIKNNIGNMCDEHGFSVEMGVTALRLMAQRTYYGMSDKGLAKLLAKYGLRTRHFGPQRLRRIPKNAILDVVSRHLPEEE